MKTRHRRKAQAEVIGAIFFVVLAMIVFSLFTALTAAQYSLARQAAEAQLVVGHRADESLSVSISSGSVQVRNNGPTTAVITYYIGVNTGGQQKIVGLSQAVTVAPRGTTTIAVSPSFQNVGVITSYGNMWWSS
jgi:archaellum component FlaG (FlaF/FlaG flagellin family)